MLLEYLSNPWETSVAFHQNVVVDLVYNLDYVYHQNVVVDLVYNLDYVYEFIIKEESIDYVHNIDMYVIRYVRVPWLP